MVLVQDVPDRTKPVEQEYCAVPAMVSVMVRVQLDPLTV
jgi:hypothetical protein